MKWKDKLMKKSYWPRMRGNSDSRNKNQNKKLKLENKIINKSYWSKLRGNSHREKNLI